MKRFLLVGLVVAAIVLAGCPVNPPNSENTNITIDDVKGEWKFEKCQYGRHKLSACASLIARL